MNAYLFPSLPTGPKTLKLLLERIPESKMDEPTHPGRFTPREVIAHCADWEPIFQERMLAAVENPECGITGMDELQRAIDMDYANLDWQSEADRFISLRADTIAWLHSIGPDDWHKAHIHSEKGRMTVDAQANMLLGHDLYHIEQLLGAID
jgi:hypothetical protein